MVRRRPVEVNEWYLGVPFPNAVNISQEWRCFFVELGSVSPNNEASGYSHRRRFRE